MGGGSSDYSSRDYDFNPAPAVSKRSASSYAKEDKRNYSPPSKGLSLVKGTELSTKSQYSAVFVLDVTGSMKDWPGLIFGKFPTLYAESNAAIQGFKLEDLISGQKLEDKLEVAVIAIGDANHDSYPVQVVNYSNGKKLLEGIKSIHPEGGGGPFGQESYELVAYLLDNHCKTPKPTKSNKPLLVFACDEDFYPSISKKQIKGLFGEDISSSLSSDDVMKSVINKFDSYVLRPEPEGSSCSVYQDADKHWKRLFEGNSQRVLKMDSPSRLVDCFIGICGYASNNIAEAEAMLRRRQTPKQVDEVLATLHPLLASKPKKPSKTGREK